MQSRWLYPISLGVLAAAVLMVLVVRFQAAPVPLERDEGEYALMGQLILDGVPPYQEAANMKLPGTYYAYAAILALFGQTPTGIHLGLLVVSLASTVILYFIARSLLNPVPAALSAASFAVMSAGGSVFGLFAHATHFVVLFALAGTLLVVLSEDSKKQLLLLFGAGLCFGLSFVMKQSGLLFAFFGLCWVVIRDLQRRAGMIPVLRSSACMLLGITIPYAAVFALMAWYGVLPRFLFWTLDYARTYATDIPFRLGISLFKASFVPLVRDNAALWLMAFVGCAGMWATKEGRRNAPFLLVFFVFSFLAVCPGLHFRRHYFVQLLPALALLAGAGLAAVERLATQHTRRAPAITVAVFLAVLLLSLSGTVATGRALGNMSADQYSRSLYYQNPFPESARIGDYIRQNTGTDDRIVVLGSEPQIYFYAHRRPATEHIYMYGLMENQPFAARMQDEMIAQIEKNKPTFLVFVSIYSSWMRRPDSEAKLFSWKDSYLPRHYRPVMAADILPQQTVWLTEQDINAGVPLRSTDKVLVFRRVNPDRSGAK